MANQSSKGGREKGSTPRKGANGAATRKTQPKKKSRRETFPYVEVQVHFSHPTVHRTFDTFYERYRQCYYHVTASLQKLRLDAGLELIYEHLERQIAEADAALRSALQELQSAIKEQLGDSSVEIKNPKKQTVTARVPGGIVRKYLNLFPLLDEYIDTVIFAETMGVITHTKKRELMRNCPRYVTSVSGRFQSLANGIDVRNNRNKDDLMKCVLAAVEAHQQMAPIKDKRPLQSKANGAAAKTPATEPQQQSAAEAWGGN